MSSIILTFLLGLCAGAAAAGYVRVAFDPFGLDRDQMSHLLIAIILALGFIGLLLK